MRVMLEFEVKENSLQADYRRLIVAWLKNLLTKVNKGKYYDKYYDNTKQKPYTFSVIFHNPIFKEDRIYFDNKGTFFYVGSKDGRLHNEHGIFTNEKCYF